MARPLRIESEDGIYHVMARGNAPGATGARASAADRGVVERRCKVVILRFQITVTGRHP